MPLPAGSAFLERVPPNAARSVLQTTDPPFVIVVVYLTKPFGTAEWRLCVVSCRNGSQPPSDATPAREPQAAGW
ncbi:hypothetical protein ACCAA_670051 [Candidatus Accumulibacter aalborgensis]|uniref:Uncharacterized protein n=1 Tax=Candidatus Accumulibacter aalborgensis TaxID=1860102 RepID=A0A1A8XWX1_9PROT|nr:hypothetical protein ACCAA_670051 [Candidatus Accumulibacter aalborgensis]